MCVFVRARDSKYMQLTRMNYLIIYYLVLSDMFATVMERAESCAK
jgi:hypothetical protein